MRDTTPTKKNVITEARAIHLYGERTNCITAMALHPETSAVDGFAIRTDEAAPFCIEVIEVKTRTKTNEYPKCLIERRKIEDMRDLACIMAGTPVLLIYKEDENLLLRCDVSQTLETGTIQRPGDAEKPAYVIPWEMFQPCP